MTKPVPSPSRFASRPFEMMAQSEGLTRSVNSSVDLGFGSSANVGITIARTKEMTLIRGMIGSGGSRHCRREGGAQQGEPAPPNCHENNSIFADSLPALSTALSK